MKKHRRKWGALVLGGSLFLLGRDLDATTVYSESEADVYLSCAENQLCSTWELRIGDFDGDRFEDLLSPNPHFFSPLPQFDKGFVVFGGDYPSGGPVPFFRNTTTDSGIYSSLPDLDIGDITGDGKEDIFYLYNSRLLVTFGRGNPPGLISPPANLTITAPAGIVFGNSRTFGDVNGDGLKDLLFEGGGGAYVVFGSTSFGMSNSTISVTDPAHCMSIVGVGSGRGFASGDVDGDHYDDIILASTGTVYVIRGGNSLPSMWDLRITSANWTILSTDGSFGGVTFAADFTGDGKAEIGLEKNFQPVLVSGANILSVGPVSDLAPGHTNSLTPTSFPFIADRTNHWLFSGDFDGDNRPDLCIQSTIPISPGINRYEISLILSHSFPSGSPLPEAFTQDSIHFLNAGPEAVLGDLNGDGKSDLIYQSETFPFVNIFYGYYPLENPRIVVQAREPNQLRVHLTLSVDGEPTEMLISGDIADAFKDQWIPYKTSLDVTLTSTEDNKQVQAQFRNAFKRESALVQESLSLAVGTQHVTVRTNRVREGGRATLDCSLTQAGRIKAAVFDQAGEKVIDLMDEEHGPGVWPVEWDGRDSENNPAAPGFYILSVDVSGQETKTTILVQR